MSASATGRRRALEGEVKERLGIVPGFFQVAASADVAERLWSHAKAAYLDSPIPPLLREELFAYLSRFCSVPYCMVHHAAFLQGVGRPGGDPEAPVRSPEAVLHLLRQPIPTHDEVERELKKLAAHGPGLDAWPIDASPGLGRAIFVAAIEVFLRGGARARCLVELRRVLGPDKLERLTALLSFIRTAHEWAEAHPGLAFEQEVDAMLAAQPDLRAWVDRYREVVREELGGHASHEGNEVDALARSTAHLGAILDDSLNEIFVFDADTLRFVQVNQGARQNLGYTTEELRALTAVDLKPDFTRDEFLELVAPLRTGEKARLEFQTRHRRKDGTLYPVEVHLQLSRAAGFHAFVAIILDLTERHAHEEVIANLEARAQAVLGAAADAILTINEHGLIDGVNAATANLLGYEEAELVGKNVRMLMPAPYREEHDGYLERYLRTGEARIIGKGREVAARHKDGTVFPVLLSVGEARFDHQRLFTGIIHDLRAQREAEAERDEGDRRLRALFNQRTNLTGICTPEGILIEVNRASLDYVGTTPDKAVGRPLWETPWWDHDPELQERLRGGLARAARGEFVRFDATHPRAGGEPGLVDFSITPVRDAAGVMDVLLVESVDVTETRKLQAQLLQSQKMEAIGTLAGGIAHDFNNLLTSIRGSSEILSEALAAEGRLARSADRIQRAADRATALTTRLLGLSRKQVTHRRPMDLRGIVEETRDLFAGTLPEDIKLVTRTDPEPVYVRADESQIGQVLMNLVLNAGDAISRGGQIEIETGREVIAPARAEALGLGAGEFALLRVRDSGVGMPAEVCAKIFDPFFTTKDPGKGTGLGLSTSLGIVREHGGAMEVESEAGQGTTFTILLPAIDAPAIEVVAAHEPSSGEVPDVSETVLLVEDDEIMRELLGEILEDEGYGVLVAPEPGAALEAAEVTSGHIDLVITDVVMPTMSGFSLAKELRARHPEVRVLFMSGYTGDVLADRGQLRENDPFLRKPFSNDVLLSKVREVLDAAPPESG